MGNKDLDHFVWQHFTPFSIGFDETFQRLESIAAGGTSYPPYNVIDGPDGRTSLEIALAGFSGDDLSVTTERNVLTVAAHPQKKEEGYRHRGIAYHLIGDEKASYKDYITAKNMEKPARSKFDD